MRKYQALFDRIKDCPHDKWIEVKVKSANQIQPIINGLQNEKSRQQVLRRRLDLCQFGKLIIRREPEKLRVMFTLSNSGDAL
jgi:hypothetical protein